MIWVLINRAIIWADHQSTFRTHLIHWLMECVYMKITWLRNFAWSILVEQIAIMSLTNNSTPQVIAHSSHSTQNKDKNTNISSTSYFNKILNFTISYKKYMARHTLLNTPHTLPTNPPSSRALASTTKPLLAMAVTNSAHLLPNAHELFTNIHQPSRASRSLATQ